MRLTTAIALILILALSIHAKKKGAPAMASGAPGDRTCHASKCHADNELNSDKAKIFLEGIPKKFIPGKVYNISLHLEQPGMKKWGFQATVVNEQGRAVGTLISVKEQNTRILDTTRYKSRTDRQYITHSLSGIKGPKKGVSPTWQIQWRAPADTTAVTPSFYFALNAANGNNKKTGDFIYTRTITVKSAIDQVQLKQ